MHRQKKSFICSNKSTNTEGSRLRVLDPAEEWFSEKKRRGKAATAPTPAQKHVHFMSLPIVLVISCRATYTTIICSTDRGFHAARKFGSITPKFSPCLRSGLFAQQAASQATTARSKIEEHSHLTERGPLDR